MPEKTTAAPVVVPDLQTKDGMLADAIERELKRLPTDDPEVQVRCVDALNVWLKRSRSGTFTQFLRKAQNIIRRSLHPERPLLKVDALVIDPNVIGSESVRAEIQKVLLDGDITAVDLKRIHEGLAQLKRMPLAKEPWLSVFQPFQTPDPQKDNKLGFTPDSFKEAARTVVWTVQADYS